MARLQAQLKELIAFPHDLQPLSNSVVAALQEFQRYPGRLGEVGLGGVLNLTLKGSSDLIAGHHQEVCLLSLAAW